ncbi:MAG: M20 family metallo-hydrolase [Actinomycetota bacterium]|nr:M20 family metallo-hydrolase [Actinomycetota bacterium]MEE2647036.1 M20 family metallo-hydrolase [Actinomycetota bacterium]|tara:strand:- start:644 stop:1900 length:1257 start_codon:yes stop_codon:yes gene_type:complete
MDLQSLRINGDRLIQRIEDLAAIGPYESTGSCRLALTDEDREGRDLVVTWMKDLGLEISIDGIGNVIATRPGNIDGPPTLTGSHIDTVATGGRYDGNLGVLAGIELIETLIENEIDTQHPVGVGFFTDEEGARFPPDMLGSLVYVGGLSLEEALEIEAIDGAILGEELTRIGYRGPAPCPAIPPRAFIELHIEQGPLLEDEGKTIGVVTGVQGISWTEYVVKGQSNHAGTTPMHLRHDAGYVAARIATEAREVATRMGGRQVATVGRMNLHPDLVNVVAREARLTVDLRNTDETLLVEAENQIKECVNSLEESEGVTIESRSLARFEPVVFDQQVIEIVSETASDLGLSATHMPSGAGHDAQMLARVCPTGMIFVPSKDGISHNPNEHTDREDLVAGANVLLQSVLALDAAELQGTEQ